MLASCLPGILPPLSAREALEVSMIHSLAGTLSEGGLVKSRPFRDPHHSASLPALVGGGHRVRPGEISLAHRGVLFLDELPEFARGTLEALRQPLETGNAVVARANAHVTYPASFQLIAAMNPCRCGYLGDPDMECTKAPRCGGEYQNKLSGPLLDRIDIQVEVGAVSISDLSDNMGDGEKSSAVAMRVKAVRQKQEERYKSFGARADGILTNAQATTEILEEVAHMDEKTKTMFVNAAERMKLSARAYHRLMKVALTIADMAGRDIILSQDVAEALFYRRLRVS